MKHPRSVIALIAFVLAALALTSSGCSLNGEVKEYRDPATLIEVEEGNEFAIVLDSNPTTGYQWNLADELDAEIVVLVKTEFEEPDTELLGAGGEEKWTFRAEGLGETSITMAYVRPWEEEGEELPGAEEETEPGGEEAEEQAEEPAGEEAEGEEETGEGEAEEAATEEAPTTVTFNVRVKKEGSMGEEPEEYGMEDEEIEVEAGLEFSVALVSNPSTGYSWQLAEPLDKSVVEFVSSEFEHKDEEGEGGEIVGAPGEEVWTFEAIAEGETEIELKYVRPWETDVAPEETKTLKVKVSAVEAGEEGE